MLKQFKYSKIILKFYSEKNTELQENAETIILQKIAEMFKCKKKNSKS